MCVSVDTVLSMHRCSCQSQKLTSSFPSARSSAVSSSMFRSIVSAPDWQRRLAMVASCLPTARCRGVHPLNMAASTLAPLLRSSFTDMMSCNSTARWRAVLPLVPSCKEVEKLNSPLKFQSYEKHHIHGTMNLNNSLSFIYRERLFQMLHSPTWGEAKQQ